MHADFGSGLWDGGPIGIPYVTVPGTQPKVPVTFEYADESDPGPYPIPPDAPIEWGSDHHILVLDRDHRLLYEVYAAEKQADGSWRAGSGAIFDLASYALRPDGYTSADAAGLPILPGLVRYDEVAAGRDHPRDPVHGPRDPPRLRLARASLCLEPDGRPVSADGPALPPPGRLRHLGLLAGGPGGPPGPEGVRHDPRGQRLVLVPLGSARLPVEQRSSRRAPAGARLRLRGRRRLVPDGGPRLGPCSARYRGDARGCRPSDGHECRRTVRRCERQRAEGLRRRRALSSTA